MKNFYYKLNVQMFTSLFFALIGFFLLYLFKVKGFQSKFVEWLLLIYSIYFCVVFILAFITRKLRYISVGDKSLKLYVGPLGFRKILNFNWGSIKPAKVIQQTFERYQPVYLWKGSNYSYQRKVLSLEFQDKIPEHQMEILSSIQKRNLLTSLVEVNNEGSGFFIIEEPKGGFDPLIKSINEHREDKGH